MLFDFISCRDDKYWLNGRFKLEDNTNFWYGSAQKPITWGAWKTGFPSKQLIMFCKLN